MGALLSLLIIGNVMVAPHFCDGYRTDDLKTYKQFLEETALPLNVWNGIKDEAENAFKKDCAINASTEAQLKACGLSGQEVGMQVLAKARYKAYLVQSGYVRSGQKHLCGQESSNW